MGLQKSLTLSAASNKEKESAIAQLEKKLEDALLKPNVAEMKELRKDLGTSQKKMDKVYSGNADKLLKAVKKMDIPLDEVFISICALLASSFYDIPLTEEDINKITPKMLRPRLTNSYLFFAQFSTFFR